MSYNVFLHGNYFTQLVNVDNEGEAFDYLVSNFGGPRSAWSLVQV